jgi:hypothetical protein
VTDRYKQGVHLERHVLRADKTAGTNRDLAGCVLHQEEIVIVIESLAAVRSLVKFHIPKQIQPAERCDRVRAFV